MGKKIDGFVLRAAAAAALYFYYRRAFPSRTAALILALASIFILRKGLRLLLGLLGRFGWLKRRRLRRRAGGALMDLASMPESDASEKLRALLGKSYSGEYDFHLVQLHPAARLTGERIFEIWKAYQGRERLAICATCPAEDGARMVAAGLQAPKVAIVDAAALSQLIAEHPEGFFAREDPTARTKLRLRRASQLLFNRKNAPRSLLVSASMLLMYFLTAKLAYLVVGLALMCIALISLHRPLRPAKLF